MQTLVFANCRLLLAALIPEEAECVVWSAWTAECIDAQIVNVHADHQRADRQRADHRCAQIINVQITIRVGLVGVVVTFQCFIIIVSVCQCVLVSMCVK